MYRYDEFDARFVRARVAEFRDQVARRLEGALTEEEFKPLRLQNGLYLQLHAYMLRVAIPYGTLSARQMRQLAMIADRWDRGYGHFTTRQNIQYNWPKLKDAPDILDALADVEMHAIQTSGNCIRNVTADHFAGAAADEIEDPRPTAELLRQWSSGHPEFAFLPRKFKIALTGAPHDRAATRMHDVGLQCCRDEAGNPGYRVLIGGGLGRTPMVGSVLRAYLPKRDLLPYMEALMRIYNLYGRRDNKFKARIKILVHEVGLEEVRAQIEAEFRRMDGPSIAPDEAEIRRIEAYFTPPPLTPVMKADAPFAARRAQDKGFGAWVRASCATHKTPGHAIVTVSLKPVGGTPGDATSGQMRALADLADRHAFGALRVSHEQNIVLPHVREADLPALYDALQEHGLATPNHGLLSDIIACPGLDYCALATARSIPIAQAISARFADMSRQRNIGPLKIKISGCINACGHHHVGHIGILGLEKAGVENYQITIGGDATEGASLGERLGPGFSAEETPQAVETLIAHYLSRRTGGEETFLQTVRRVGVESFRDALYADRR